MSKIYTYIASMAPRGTNPIMYKHLTYTEKLKEGKKKKKKKKTLSSISKLVKTLIANPRYESTLFFDENARKDHESTLI